jgi:hypothetical protein
VPSTALREVSLLQMLSESAFIVRCAPGPVPTLWRPTPPPDSSSSPQSTWGEGALFFKRPGTRGRTFAGAPCAVSGGGAARAGISRRWGTAGDNVRAVGRAHGAGE